MVAPESSRWIESFNAFDTKAQEGFNRCDFGLSLYILLLNVVAQVCPGKLALLAFPLYNKGVSPFQLSIAMYLFLQPFYKPVPELVAT